jgi:hypothetical protein
MFPFQKHERKRNLFRSENRAMLKSILTDAETSDLWCEPEAQLQAF